MNKTDKIREGQIQIDDEHNYKPLVEPMLKKTHSKVVRLINYGRYTVKNITMTWRENGKHPIHQEYQSSTL